MNRSVRAVSFICICLLFVTSARYGGAQDSPPPAAPIDSIPVELSLPNIEREGLGVKGEDGEEKFERMEANRSLMGGDLGEDFKLHAIEELRRQQQLYAQQMAGANAPDGVPSWRSIGPTQAKYQTNGVTLKVSDSGRIRTILPHP